ncbi:hypothetical protein BJV78DRAFT_1205009 [Lactifluus subvellereus]|nr:hypothetical protein BJV78DRAFT_1205009 [Lactifluus subvellereus]
MAIAVLNAIPLIFAPRCRCHLISTTCRPAQAIGSSTGSLVKSKGGFQIVVLLASCRTASAMCMAQSWLMPFMSHCKWAMP